MAERVLQGEVSIDEWVLSTTQLAHFRRLKELSLREEKPMVLWGWKRDEIIEKVQTPNSRTIYFSADLGENDGRVEIERAFFFLETRAKQEEIEALRVGVNNSQELNGYQMNVLTWNDPVYNGYARLRMIVGEPSKYDRATVQRRLKGKPRLSIPAPCLVPESDSYDLSSLAPFALCVGSGVSAESGLPLLGSIHNLFEVDNMATGKLVFGAADNLPRRIVTNVKGEFRDFCRFTIDAIKAEPSLSHELISDLYEKGVIKQIFTDNADDILEKINVPFTRTRLSIFPDRFPAMFDSKVKALLVLGVAVDRRDVVKQARHKGLKIIAVNPVLGVAPHSRNMDYLRRGDIFFREEARVALPKIIEASAF